MKTETILERLNSILAIPDAANSYRVSYALREIISQCESDLRLETASSRGTLNATKIITAMLKEQESSRKALAYPWIDNNKRQCVCNGFMAFRLNDGHHLPLPERPENIGDAIDLDKLYPRIIEGMKELPMPAASEVKAEIAIQRSKYTGRRNGFTPYWDFGHEAPTVDANCLLKVIAVLPHATKLFWNTLVTPLYIADETGDALLLPVRVQGKQQPAAKSDAERTAIADEQKQTQERNAEAAKRYETIRKAHDDYAAANEKVRELLKQIIALDEKRKKATSSGIIAEYDAKMIELHYEEARWELKRHNAELVFNPDACIELDRAELIFKGLLRMPPKAVA